MEDFGKRLKEERERLGLSQAKFAELCGVGRTAQFNYERGERHPSSVYLDAAESLGVDTLYVMTATRKGKDWGYARAYSLMLYTFEMLLGLEEEQLERLAAEAVALETPFEHREPLYSNVEWNDRFLNWIRSATKPERCIDVPLLARLLDAVSEEAGKVGASLSTEKRLRVALMLYADAKRNGPADQLRVSEAIKLAS